MKRFLSFIFIVLISIININMKRFLSFIFIVYASEPKDFKILYLVDNNNNLDVKDYEKSLKVIEANKLIKEEQRKIKLQAAIKEIESQGFEVDYENKTLAALLYVEDSKDIYEKATYYNYKYLKLRYVEELNKYTKKPFYLKFENPLGEDFIIDYGDLLATSRLSSGDIMISSFLNKDQVLNNIEFESIHLKYYDGEEEGGGLEFDVRLKGNNHIENFHFKYQRSTPKNPDIMELRIDIDKLTGKKAERIESTNHWGEH